MAGAKTFTAPRKPSEIGSSAWAGKINNAKAERIFITALTGPKI